MCWAWTAMACLLLWPQNAEAQAAGDRGGFDVRGDAWNDLGDLVALSEGLGFPANTPDRLELWKLPPEDAVILVHPTVEPPVRAITDFVRGGGRVALLDDFGTGHALLRNQRIGRHAAVAPDPSRRLRGNPNVAIATPVGRHSLTLGVEALVTNHPQVLHHSVLQPKFTLDDDGGGAVVLSGMMDEGYLVAVGDSSVVINNMLRFRGNRRFAENLIRFLAGDRGGQLWIVSGATPLVGRDAAGAPDHMPTALRERLRNLADQELPPRMVWLFSLVLLTVFTLFAAASLPRRGSAYRPTIEETPVLAGYAGRVGFFDSPRRNLFGALMAYKFEFESELVRRLQLPGRPSRSDVVGGLRARAGAATAGRAEALLQALDAHALQKDRAPAPPRIGAAAFGDMVEDGRRILAALEPAPQPEAKHG